MLTYGQLKTDIRKIIFASGEAVNLVAAHDKYFLDAMIDLQTWVPCLQQDNTELFPQCSTFYNCGLTVLPAPRGIIKGVSIIDKINPETGEEDANSPDDWCSEIKYREVNFCDVQRYISGSRSTGCCLSVPLFFSLSPSCSKRYPTPTGEGLPTNLPALPLGFAYPQSSTDRTWGRAGGGVFAKDRGKIYIAPWIQTTETVIVKWDGIKRTWADNDPVDEDPLLATAVMEYVRWQHADKHDKDEPEMIRAMNAYQVARANLIHQCTEETRARDCEPSQARMSTSGTGTLYYNDEQSATASCAAGTTGDPVSVTIPAGTIGSTISKADANQKAQDEAQTQAESRLDCQPETTVYQNTPQTYTASCVGGEDAPAAEGSPVTVTIPAGMFTSEISQADADAQAMAEAQAQAESRLACTFWNKEQTATAICEGNPGITATDTVPAHSISSSYSQADADRKALELATNNANSEIADTCTGGLGIYLSTEQKVFAKTYTSCKRGGVVYMGTITINVTVVAAYAQSANSVAEANLAARAAGNAFAQERIANYSSVGMCGTFDFTI